MSDKNFWFKFAWPLKSYRHFLNPPEGQQLLSEESKTPTLEAGCLPMDTGHFKRCPLLIQNMSFDNGSHHKCSLSRSIRTNWIFFWTGSQQHIMVMIMVLKKRKNCWFSLFKGINLICCLSQKTDFYLNSCIGFCFIKKHSSFSNSFLRIILYIICMEAALKDCPPNHSLMSTKHS